MHSRITPRKLTCNFNFYIILANFDILSICSVENRINHLEQYIYYLKIILLRTFAIPRSKSISQSKKKKKMQILLSKLQVVKSTSPGLLPYTIGLQNTRKNKLKCGNPFPVHGFLVVITCKPSKQGDFLFAFLLVFSFFFFRYSEYRIQFTQ